VVNTSHAVSLKKADVHKHASNEQKVEMDSNLEIKHLQTVLLSAIPATKRSLPVQHKQIYKNINKQVSGDAQKEVQGDKLQFITAQPSQEKVSKATLDKQWFTGMLTKSVKLKNLYSIVTDSIESSSDSTATHQPGDVLNIITLLDTGGQPQFIHLLPIVNVYPTVNFVIHDLSKDLNDQVLVEYSQHGKHTFQRYNLSYTNLDMIKLLVTSNNDCLEMSPPAVQLLTHPGTDKNSYLCFIGTHVNKVEKEIVQKADKTLTALVKRASNKVSVLQYKGNVLFPVDNTTAGRETDEDSIADVIRNEIEKIVEKKEIYELPITWMLLQLEIRQVCSNDAKFCISFKECVAIAKASQLMSNPEEVKNALLYHHLLGVLLFFDDIPNLQDYVIVDHQWLFDKLSNIINFTFQYDSLCHNEVYNLKHKGILSMEVLQKVKWDSDINEGYFLSLLAHLKIIAPLHGDTNCTDEYFIPCILPACSAEQRDTIIQRYGFLQGEPLLIQFQSGLLPRGLFCCLVVHLLQNPPLNWQPHFATSGSDTHHTFSDLITYSLPDDFSLLLFDNVSHLEVQIRHQESVISSSSHYTVCQEIYHSLKLVCIQLSFNSKRLQAGFYCCCGESIEPHIAVLPEKPTMALYARCSNNSLKQIKLTSCHLVWFKEVQPTTEVGKIFAW